MLSVKLDEDQGFAILEPEGELTKADFESASALIDPYIEEHGCLNGLVILVQSFPGWDSFTSLVAHLRFVKEHHRKVSRIAFATDSQIAGMAEKIAPHFVNAEIKSFAFDEFESARKWILDGANE